MAGRATGQHRGGRRVWWAAAAAVVIAVGGGGAVWWTHRDPAVASRSTTSLQPVTLGSVSQSVSLTGTFVPTREADLSFGASGTVATLPVAVGDKVRAGQALATIDTTVLTASETAAADV